MKASYFEQNGTKKIELEDGTIFEAQEKETKGAFIKRIGEVVDSSYFEKLELTEQKKEKATKGKAVVKEKGEEKVATKKEATKKEPKPKAEPKAKKEPKPKAEPKEKKPKPTLNDALEMKKNAESMVGKMVDFVPFRCAYTVTGEVKQVVIDNRVNRAYFRIYDADNKLYHTDVTNEKVVVNEKETAALEKRQEEQRLERLKLIQEKAQQKQREADERKIARAKAREERKAQRAAEREALAAEQVALREAKKDITKANTDLKKALNAKAKVEAKIQELQAALAEKDELIAKAEDAVKAAEAKYAEEQAALETDTKKADDEAAGSK